MGQVLLLMSQIQTFEFKRLNSNALPERGDGLGRVLGLGRAADDQGRPVDDAVDISTQETSAQC